MLSANLDPNAKFGLNSNTLTPQKSLDVYLKRYKGFLWSHALSLQGAFPGLDADEVFQELMIAAWMAAADENYDSSCGASIITFMHRKVLWKIGDIVRVATRRLSFETQLPLVRDSNEEAEFDSSLTGVGAFDGCGRVEERVEAREFINKALLVAEDVLPVGQWSMIFSLLDDDERDLLVDGAQDNVEASGPTYRAGLEVASMADVKRHTGVESSGAFYEAVGRLMEEMGVEREDF